MSEMESPTAGRAAPMNALSRNAMTLDEINESIKHLEREFVRVQKELWDLRDKRRVVNRMMDSPDEIRERIFARIPRLRLEWDQERQFASVNKLRQRFHALTENLEPWELRSLEMWIEMWLDRR